MFTTARRLAHLARPVTVALVALATVSLTATEALGYEQGIDVSRYQHSTSLDWSKVKADGVEFAFIKATEGRSYTNPYFAPDWAATTRLGIYRGAYHFARPSKGTAAAQASYFVNVAGPAHNEGDLPLVLDLEATGGLGVAALRTWTSNFLKTVESLTGRTPIIYCSPSFWENYLGNSTAFTRYPLWIAHYTSASQPRVPGGWSTWTFWQNTSSGKVNGISGNVDEDRFNGTLDDLKRLAQVPARAATTTTMGASQTAVTAGQTVQFSSTVAKTSGGAPVAGGTVALARRLPGTTTWTRLSSGVTDTAGQVVLSAVVDQAASYRTRFVGTTTYAPSSSSPVDVTLPPAPATPTATTVQASLAAVYAGQSVRFASTVLTDEASGSAPVVGRTVALARRLAGTTSWVPLTTGVTDATGHVDLTTVVDKAASYQASLVGDSGYASSTSQPVDITLLPRVATSLTIKAGTGRVRRRHPVTLFGHLRASDGTGLAGKSVVLLRRTLGTSRWVKVRAGTTLAPTGWWQVTARPRRASAFKAVYRGNLRYRPATSARVRVYIRR